MQCIVSTHSRLKAAGGENFIVFSFLSVSTHSRLKAAGCWSFIFTTARGVSTHSRLKAAGFDRLFCKHLKQFQHTAARRRLGANFSLLGLGFLCFNTQPPEGGWSHMQQATSHYQKFQHTAARRRLGSFTYRRPRERICFNTQPPEGGWTSRGGGTLSINCFNTQPPEGGWHPIKRLIQDALGFNTQPPEGGWAKTDGYFKPDLAFQHTAARRRLASAYLVREAA